MVFCILCEKIVVDFNEKEFVVLEEISVGVSPEYNENKPQKIRLPKKGIWPQEYRGPKMNMTWVKGVEKKTSS